MQPGYPTGAVRRRWPLATAVVALLLTTSLLLAPTASAHPYLVASTPQSGVVAPQAPTSIQIAFTEGLVINGSSISLTGPGGHRVAVGPLRAVLGGEAMSAKLPKLDEGIYNVHWVAYGNDGHTVEGSYQFGVPSPSGQAPPGASKLLATTTYSGESAPTESLISVVGRWLAAIAAFALLGAAILFGRLRGRLEDDDALDRAQARWLRLAPLALGIALIGSLAEAYKRADGVDGLDLGLLTSATSGVAIVVRLGILLTGGVLAVLVLRRASARTRTMAFAATGALTLSALAVDGHVATVHQTPVIAAVGMVVHLLSGGVWIGALIVIAACVAPVAIPAAVRAYAPVAIGAAAVMIVTGVIAAVREVSRWYFLRWSTYGHILSVKVVLVALIMGLGAAGTLLGRRAARFVRIEAVFGVLAVGVAALLAGTLQGRGQTLPSQRGNLLPGAGFADVAVTNATAQMTLAPAEVGLNRIIVNNVTSNSVGGKQPGTPTSVSVAFACACGGTKLSFHVTLHPGSAGPNGPWSGEVALPRNGTYSTELTEDGKPTVGAPTFTVGDVHTPGSTPVEIASVADLSGPDATQCRSQEYGALIAIELMNAAGGINGAKLHQVLLDDQGSASLARSEAAALERQHPAAFLAPCGAGAQAAIQAVGDTTPTIVADDGVPVTAGRYVYRLAPNPYAEGYAAGQYIGKIGVPSSPGAVKRVAVIVADQEADLERADGLKAALAKYGVKTVPFSASAPDLTQRIESLLPASRWLGIYADAGFDQLTAALRQAGAATYEKVAPTPIIVPQTLASEQFVIDSGDLGAEGQVRAITDVDPTTNDASLYAELSGQVVGEQPTVPGLGGFVAGQALAYGLVNGDSVASIAARLRSPGVFSKVATSPWSSQNPASGTLIFRMILAEFLPDNLIPAGGGSPSEPYEGTFFTNGAWEPASPELFSPLKINLSGADGVTTAADGTYGSPVQNPAGGGTDAGGAAAAKLRAKYAAGPAGLTNGGTP